MPPMEDKDKPDASDPEVGAADFVKLEVDEDAAEAGAGGRSGRRIFPCPHCSKSLSSASSLDRHVKAMHETRPVCHVCGLTLCTQETLKAHVKAIHDKIKDIMCDQCDYKCSSLTVLYQHRNRIHLRVEQKVLVCQHCGFKATQNAHLRQHIEAVHLGKKDHKCAICGFTTAWKHVLRNHARTHGGDTEKKAFACSHCSFTSAWSHCLRNHVKKHGIVIPTSRSKRQEDKPEAPEPSKQPEPIRRAEVENGTVASQSDDVSKSEEITVCPEVKVEESADAWIKSESGEDPADDDGAPAAADDVDGDAEDDGPAVDRLRVEMLGEIRKEMRRKENQIKFMEDELEKKEEQARRLNEDIALIRRDVRSVRNDVIKMEGDAQALEDALGSSNHQNERVQVKRSSKRCRDSSDEETSRKTRKKTSNSSESTKQVVTIVRFAKSRSNL